MAEKLTPAVELGNSMIDSVGWALTLPNFTKPDRIWVNTERMGIVSAHLGCRTLRVATEVGSISDRSYDVYSSGAGWAPTLDTDSRENIVPVVRTQVDDISTGEPIDWIVLNIAEMTERFLALDYMSRGSGNDTPVVQSTWAGLLNSALREGVAELVRERRRAHMIPFEAAFVILHKTWRKDSLVVPGPASPHRPQR